MALRWRYRSATSSKHLVHGHPRDGGPGGAPPRSRAAAAEAERNIIAVASLVNTDRRRLLAAPKAGPASYRLFELLPLMPRFTVEQARHKLDTIPTANAAVRLLEEQGILSELTGQKTNRVYSYGAYVALLMR